MHNACYRSWTTLTHAYPCIVPSVAASIQHYWASPAAAASYSSAPIVAFRSCFWFEGSSLSLSSTTWSLFPPRLVYCTLFVRREYIAKKKGKKKTLSALTKIDKEGAKPENTKLLLPNVSPHNSSHRSYAGFLSHPYLISHFKLYYINSKAYIIK
jgi:hypothetical protein